PKDGVLAKTFSLELEHGNPSSRRRLETQILHFDGTTWRGYSYEWNDEQTDAALVPAAGKDRTFAVTDPQAPGGRRTQTWHFPSRTECLTCHNPWAAPSGPEARPGHTPGAAPPLAFTPLQLNRPCEGGAGNELFALRDAGLITLLHQDELGKTTPWAGPTPAARLTDPYAPGADPDE